MISLITNHIAKTHAAVASNPNQRERGVTLPHLAQDTFTRSTAAQNTSVQGFQPMFRGITVPSDKTAALLRRIKNLYETVAKNSSELAQDSDLGELLGTNNNKKYEIARDYSGLARAYLTYNAADPLCHYLAQSQAKKALNVDPESRLAKGVLATLESSAPKHPLDEKSAAALQKIEQLNEIIPSKIVEFNSQGDETQDPELAQILGITPTTNPSLGKDFSDLAQAYMDYNSEDDLCRFHAHGHAGSALLVDPQNHHAHFILGKLESEAEDALPHLKKAVSLAPYNAEYINVRAIRNYFAGDMPAALKDYTRLIEIEPKVTEHRIQRGYALLDQDQPQEALKDFEKACELDSQNYRSYSGKGTAQLVLDDSKGAIHSFEKALSLKPQKDDLAEIHSNLGSAYFADDNYGKALKHLDKALKLGTDPGALYTRAVANVIIGKYDHAALDAKNARILGYDDPSTYTVEAMAHSYKGNQDEAETIMTEAYSRFPDYDYDKDADELDAKIVEHIKRSAKKP